MYLKLGKLQFGRPRNPGSLGLETPSFDGIIKQHEDRQAHLTFRLDSLAKDVTTAETHATAQQIVSVKQHEARLSAINNDLHAVVTHIYAQKAALRSELEVIGKRLEGFKALSGKI